MTISRENESLLFGLLGESGKFSRRKDGGFALRIKGVDEVQWFTDRPLREDGSWKPQRLVKRWDSMFGSDGPNAQASFTSDGRRELVTFEMSRPKWNKSEQQLLFQAKPIGDASTDSITGLVFQQLDDISLFIDNYIIGKNGLSLEYAVSDDYENLLLTFNIENPSDQGWAGLVPHPYLFPSDGIFVSWNGTEDVYAFDTYNPGIPTLSFFPSPILDSNPLFDSANTEPTDGQLNVELVSSSLNDGVLSIVVQRPLVTDDIFDAQFQSGTSYSSILGSGSGFFDLSSAYPIAPVSFVPALAGDSSTKFVLSI